MSNHPDTCLLDDHDYVVCHHGRRWQNNEGFVGCVPCAIGECDAEVPAIPLERERRPIVTDAVRVAYLRHEKDPLIRQWVLSGALPGGEAGAHVDLPAILVLCDELDAARRMIQEARRLMGEHQRSSEPARWFIDSLEKIVGESIGDGRDD